MTCKFVACDWPLTIITSENYRLGVLETKERFAKLKGDMQRAYGEWMAAEEMLAICLFQEQQERERQ